MYGITGKSLWYNGYKVIAIKLKKLLHLGLSLGASFCHTSIILHMLTQISIALSATLLSSAHLVAQNENGNNVIPVTLI